MTAVYIFIGIVAVALFVGNYIIYRKHATKSLNKTQSFFGAIAMTFADLFFSSFLKIIAMMSTSQCSRSSDYRIS